MKVGEGMRCAGHWDVIVVEVVVRDEVADDVGGMVVLEAGDRITKGILFVEGAEKSKRVVSLPEEEGSVEVLRNLRLCCWDVALERASLLDVVGLASDFDLLNVNFRLGARRV